MTHFFIIIKIEMKKEHIIAQIQQIISPILESENIELVDFELKGAVGNQILRIYVDVVGGISLNSCVELSRKISDRLDIEDIMPGKYRLEVSSPGVQRPLKTLPDFRRNIGRQVKVTNLEGKCIDGLIKDVDDTDILIEVNGEQVKISLSVIKFGKLVLQW